MRIHIMNNIYKFSIADFKNHEKFLNEIPADIKTIIQSYHTDYNDVYHPRSDNTSLFKTIIPIHNINTYGNDISSFRASKIVHQKLFIAGGAVVRLIKDLPASPSSDIDLWGSSIMNINVMYNTCLKCLDPRDTIITQNAITFKKDKIQLILKPYNDTYKLFKHFDISICKVATDLTNVWIHHDAYNDLMHNRFRLVKKTNNNPSITCKRIFKYCRYGFEPSKATIKYLSNNISTSNMSLNTLLNGLCDYEI